jgi:hypothetical protein
MGHHGDLVWAGIDLIMLGTVLNLVAESALPYEAAAWTWKAKFAAVNRRHPLIRGVVVACLMSAAILYAVAV